MRLMIGLVAAMALLTSRPAAAEAANLTAGFQTGRLADGTDLAIWYPAAAPAAALRTGIYEQSVASGADPQGSRLPLIVISHGSGSVNLAHSDTAVALAEAGFVVVAMTHPGDNWRDRAKATDLGQRVRTLSMTITFMLQDWAHSGLLDARRIGAFGYSAGGFTVLAAAGGQPDLGKVAAHCQRLPAAFECQLLKDRAAPQTPPPAWSGLRDRRLKALVVAAPALGYTFAPAGLRQVKLPVQLWRAGNDPVIPAPYYADAVRAALPRKPEFRDVPGAGHFDFIARCAAGSPPVPICQTPAFDRETFHQQFNAAVVAFFKRKL